MLEKSDGEYLARHLALNNVVLFLGAGFSTDAQNGRGETLPTSRELAVDLWNYLGYPGIPDGTSLGILYQAALNRKGGTTPLFQLLREKLTVASCPDWYESLLKRFWHRIYTTNVDDLVEYVYRHYAPSPGLSRISAPAEYQDRDAFLNSIQLVKLHGSVDQTEAGLTFAPIEYGRRAAEQDVWYDHFVRDFATHPTLLMGTELDEPLFYQYVAIRQRRIKNASERRRKSFLVCPHISEAKRQALSDFNIIPVEATAKDFFQMLDEAVGRVSTRQEVLCNLDPSFETIFNLERAGAVRAEINIAERFLAILRPVRVLEKVTGRRSHFLLGSPPSWEDIHSHLDADREVSEDVHHLIKKHLLSQVVSTPIIMLSGAAGSGKTTIAKRVSIMCVDEGFSVYFAEKEFRPEPNQIIDYLRSLERRVVLVFDEAADDLRLIRELVVNCDGLRYKPVLFITARSNELALKRYVLEGLNDVAELKVPDLSDADIDAILQTLKRSGLLGDLREMTYPDQMQVFRSKAKKQILVAMREATKGKGFDEIIQDEFDQIKPRQAQLLYLLAAIPSMHHYTIRYGQLIAAMELSPNETTALIEDNLNGILVPYDGDLARLQIRHPLIAEHVLREVVPREILGDAYVRYLEIIAHDLPPKKDRRASRAFRIYRDVINHKNLHSVFLNQVELCRNIYESVRPHFVDDGHFHLQYGSYELEYGDLDFAENYLLQAEKLMPTHPWVGTAMGYLLMRKAVEAKSLMAANEFRELGLKKLEQQILSVGAQDPYPYHVLGSQELAFIRCWCLEGERIRRLQDLYTRISNACKQHPLDGNLRSLAEGIKKAELQSVLDDY